MLLRRVLLLYNHLASDPVRVWSWYPLIPASVVTDCGVMVVNSNPRDDLAVLQDLANIEYVIKETRIVAQSG